MRLLAAIIVLIITSCASSQKKLQRRIEKNGIKESISFVVLKYPEYFKSVPTINDTVILYTRDTVIKADTINTFLKDSNNVLTYNDSLVSININKATNKVKIVVKEKLITIHDTIPLKIPCPEIICPEVEALKDNINQKSKYPYYLWVIIFFETLILALFFSKKLKQ